MMLQALQILIGLLQLWQDAVFTQGFSISNPNNALILLTWAGDT